MKALAEKIGGKDGQGMKFADDGTVEANKKLWKMNKDGSGIEVPKGVNPSAAMEDFIRNSDTYKLDCGMGVQMMQLAAMYEALGPDKFNEQMKRGGCQVKMGGMAGALAAVSKMQREDPDANERFRPPGVTAENVDGAQGDWMNQAARPGDSVYFDNPGASKAARTGGWGGENAIYLGTENGERMYFAHPMGVVSEKKVFDKLNTVNSDPTNTPVVRREEAYRPTMPRA